VISRAACAALLTTIAGLAHSSALELIKVARGGGSFVGAESGKPFRVWGVNYDHDSEGNGRLIEDYWDWVGTVRFFRRPLSGVIQPVADAGFVIEKLFEPLPIDEFRRLKPEAYESSLRWPDFLILSARPVRQ